MANNHDTQKTAIIIGAGPAGLTAAYCLLRDTDIKPIILEESHDIGGISKTVEYKGNRIDLGGHRFFSKSREVNELWHELVPTQGAPSIDDKKLGVEKPLVENGPDPESEDRVLLVRNRISRIFFLRKFFDFEQPNLDHNQIVYEVYLFGLFQLEWHFFDSLQQSNY